MTTQIKQRAAVLLGNTKKLRFFRGQTYDSDADEYLRELHAFLSEIISLEAPRGTETRALVKELHVSMISEAGVHYAESDLGERVKMYLELLK